MRCRWLVCTLLFVLAFGNEDSHHYKQSEEVVLWVNKVGPYHNPHETYPFYSLPFCKPKNVVHYNVVRGGLGSALEGNDLVNSGFNLQFRTDIKAGPICTMTLNSAQAEDFTYAVRHNYWYQMFLDDLPAWGMVGEMLGDSNDVAHIYTHKAFTVLFNKDQIIQLDMTSEDPRPVRKGQKIDLTYSVQWKATKAEFELRFDRYLDSSFFEHQIHWFSIFNSFMVVIFLCGVVALILVRTLRTDYQKFTEDDDSDELEMDLRHVVDESGWKQVHGDVFRAPRFLAVFSSLLGTGCQLFALALAVIVINVFSDMHTERGAVTTTVVMAYAATTIVAGFFSAKHFKQYGGASWKVCMVLTAGLFPGCVYVVAAVLNTIAISYASTSAVPFGTIVQLAALYLFIALPLLVLGTVLGRRSVQGPAGNDRKSSVFPCRVNALRRPIPESPVHLRPTQLALIAGLLPFLSIFIEMYFVFSSFWNYKFYYVYGFLLLIFVILTMVTCCVSIISVYLLLNNEDYRWHWTALGSGLSVAFYAFAYSVYYFHTRTFMSGFLQTAFYFGHTAVMCLAIGLLCGAVGYLATQTFVMRIYHNIKSD